MIYQVCEIGSIVTATTIQWENGILEEIKLEQMPPDFISFKIGQRFEAVSIRDSINSELQKVVSVTPLRPLVKPELGAWERTQTSDSKLDWNIYE